MTADLDFMAATATPEQVGRFGLRLGDSVFTKDSETADDIGIPAFIDTDGLVCGYHLAIARPDVGLVDPRYLYYVLKSQPSAEQWLLLASGVTRVGLRSDDIPKLMVATPRLADQELVSQHLDSESKRVLRLIGHHEVLVDTLLERRQASVTQVFLANGAASTVPLKRVADIQTGVTLGQVVDEGVEVPYLRVANVQAGWLNLDVVKTVVVDPLALPRHLLRPGDVLMTEGGDLDKLGRGAVWPGEIAPCVHQNHVFAVRCTSELLNSFLVYWMDAMPARQYFRDNAKKTTNLAAINRTILGMLPVLLPSLPEQQAVVARLDAETSVIDTLIEECRALIALLKERRAALITAAVTGKIGVRTA